MPSSYASSSIAVSSIERRRATRPGPRVNVGVIVLPRISRCTPRKLRAGVELRGDAGGRLRPVVERRGDRELLVADRGQPAVAGRPERDPLLLLLAVAVRGEHLRAREHQPHRPADVAGGHRGQRHVRPDHRLGAEAAADEVRDHPDVRQRQAEQVGDGELGRRGRPSSSRRASAGRRPRTRPSTAPPSGCGGWRPSGGRRRRARRPARVPASTSPRSLRPGISPPNSRSASYACVAALVDRGHRRARARTRRATSDAACCARSCVSATTSATGWPA